MAGAGSTLGKARKGKGAPADKAAASQAKAGRSPGESGPSHAKAGQAPGKAEKRPPPLKAEPPPGRAEGPDKAAAAKPPEAEKTPAKSVEGVPLKTINSKSQLDMFIREAGERLVVIFFSGTWCETCQGLKPAMSEMAQLNNLVMFYEVNVDDSEDTAEACDIVHIPTFQFYKLGKKVAEILDDSKESVEEKIKELK
ncbi:thioredoxin-like [Pristis pectinata]|uniref:thioredoxin-like n=1 Tax=Pristis pectinata TaxID=685728 RepID=UPI00223DFFCC|nr:thioredoxin-like [Pristis pectinata]